MIDPDTQNRVRKLTKRNEFGLFPHFDLVENTVGLRPASPIEYFDRLLLQNEWFEDDIQLVGIGLTEAGSIYTLTSQPFIKGRASTTAEIGECLLGLGFTEIDVDLAAWIEPKEKVVISDAHPRNVVTDSKGRILPIDLIMGRY